MLNTLNVYKPIGSTPYQIVKRVKEVYPELQSEKIGYAGRLDPMAEGVLLLLVGNENKNKSKYEQLDKTYQFEVLFGVATDSYDLLGLIQQSKPNVNPVHKKIATEVLMSFIGSQEQQYPPYSSVHVNGKPLFYWARNNLLHTVTIPKKKITIQKMSIDRAGTISKKLLRETVLKRIALVSGNFRQQQIIKQWDIFFTNSDSFTLPLWQCTVTCSSGTYIRELVKKWGDTLCIPTTTFSIKRTSVGPYSIVDSIDLFSHENSDKK